LDTLTFDIETIPQQAPLTTIQQEELERHLEKTYSKNVDWTDVEKENYKRLIMATNPIFGEIICIGLHRTTKNSNHYLYDSKTLTLNTVGSEKQILTSFWKILEHFNGIFISFNGLDFDVPFIIKRSMKYNILPTNNSFLDRRRFSTKPHFDVKLVFGDWDKYAFGNLRLLSDYLGIESPKEGAVKAENVEYEFKQGHIDLIAEYCLKDVEATYKIYELLKNYQYQFNKY